MRPTLAIFSKQNLIHNIKIIKQKASKSKIIAMVKANAYGHGIKQVSLHIEEYIDILGVASIDEALILRKIGVKCPILLAEGVFQKEEYEIAVIENFHIVIHCLEQLSWLETDLAKKLNIWIKIDTGMGRLGFALDKIPTYNNINLMSHFACADEKSHPLNQKQIDNFSNCIKRIPHNYKSFCNSAGIFNFPEQHYDFVRPGLALYGVSPIENKDLGLKQVMTLQTKIIAVKEMRCGDSCGYGAIFICPESMPTAIIAIGYGDGYQRELPQNTKVLINNRICFVIGRISMDRTIIDIRNYPDAKVGDIVILWGGELPIIKINYSPYALLTGIQSRVQSIWI